ncbi:MAG: MerR family transcriptional regulator [bacterium]|nr:MerR family transcriptional regulator [bacterium]
MKELFTIGEIGRLFHINVRTLRFYDEAGVLKPEQTDEKTGYRYYSTKQFERLNTIKYLRALNMPLEKIVRFFENKDTDTLAALLNEQLEETAAQIAQLQKIEKKLKKRMEQLTDAINSVTGEIRVLSFPERKVAFLRKEIHRTDDLEYPIRELEGQFLADPMMFLGKVGVTVSQEDLKARKFVRFSGIFVFLEEEDGYQGDVQKLAAGEYAVIRYQGTHSLGKEAYCRLLDWMEQNGYQACGDSVEITLIDAGFTNNTEKYVTELQIPVRAVK